MKNKGLIAVFLMFILLGFSGFVASQESDTEPIFSIRILDFQSPVVLGEFLEFSYFTRSVSGVDGTAELNFWIEKNGQIITSGADTIYLGGSEEKTRTADIFLPTSVKSGVYDLKIEAEYQGEMVGAYRTIEINVKGGSAIINFGFGKINVAILLILILLAVLNIYVVYHFEKTKIQKLIQEEEQFIKRHRISFLTASFFIILGALVYYLNFVGFLPQIPLYYYYLILAVLLLIVLFLVRHKKRASN